MILKFSVLEHYSEKINHGITTKKMGSFNDMVPDFKSQADLLKRFTKYDPIFSEQLHGESVTVVKKRPKKRLSGDAFITNKKNIPLAIKIADCQGILIFDPKKNVIAAVHSGWRSSALNIIGKTITKMGEAFGSHPTDLRVGISPSLGSCCAEFSDPDNELPAFMKPYIKNRHVDLWSAAIDQLKSAGVPKKQIKLSKECTKCNPDKYFSHRNKDLGRMAVFISLR